MAFTPLVPGSINVAHRRGAQQAYKSTAALDFAGAAVNLSAFAALAAKLVAISPGPNTADVSVGTVTADANGICTLTIAEADLATNPAGTAQLVITGQTTGGDPDQLLASGTFQLLEG